MTARRRTAMASLATLLLLLRLLPAASSEGLLRGGGGDRALASRGGDGDAAPGPSSNSTGTGAGVEHHRSKRGPMGGMEARIIGGSRAPSGRNPYTVALMDDRGLFCGGVLVADDMVLTAAHCGDGKSSFQVLAGTEKISSGGELIYPARGWIHPRFSWVTMDNDFMMFQLERPVRGGGATPVRVNDDSGSPGRKGDELVALGWGDTTASSSSYKGSNDLMKVKVDYIPNNECQGRSGYVNLGNNYDTLTSYNNKISKSMLCSLAPGRDGCQGDSGGPLVREGRDSKGSQDVLVGLSSWGYACAHRTLPGVYARVSTEYRWIKGIVCEHSDDRVQKGVFGCGGSGGGNKPPNKPPIVKAPKPKPPNNKPKAPNNKPSNKPPSKNPGKKPSNKPAKKPSKKKKKKKKKNKNKNRIYRLGGRRQRRPPRREMFKT